MAHKNGQILSGESLDIVVEGDPIKVPSVWQIRSIQVDAVGAGTLAVLTRCVGQSVFTEQATVTAGTTIIDMVGVAQVRLTASVDTVDFAFDTYGIR